MKTLRHNLEVLANSIKAKKNVGLVLAELLIFVIIL